MLITEKNPIKEINIEMHSIAPDKNCTCQLEDAQTQEGHKLSVSSSTVECSFAKPSACQDVGSNAGSCAPGVGVDRVISPL